MDDLLADAAADVERTRSAYQEALNQRDTTIRTALDGGMPGVRVAEQARVSEQMVSRLRSGSRSSTRAT